MSLDESSATFFGTEPVEIGVGKPHVESVERINDVKMANTIVVEVIKFVRPINLQVEHTSVTEVLRNAVARADGHSMRGQVDIVTLLPTGMSNWAQKDAAELLSISPRVMNYKIKTLEIELPRGRRGAAVRSSDPTGSSYALG